MSRARPVYLNLLKIKQASTALVSIMHRISGAVLFLFIPYLLYLLQASFANLASYARLQQSFDHWFVKLVILGLSWAFFHHLVAGIRYLALDMHWGIEIEAARATSKLVLALGILLTVLFGIYLW